MSRKRDEKRKKQKELARQMGVKKGEVSEHHYLQEKERVTRPELRLVTREKAGGLKGLFAGKARPLFAAAPSSRGQAPTASRASVPRACTSCARPATSSATPTRDLG